MTRRAPTFRPVYQQSGQVAPKPSCELVRHTPGRRVQFTRWCAVNNQMEKVRGKVLAHVDRTLTIRTDAGEEVSTSCGHVTEVRR